MIEELDKHSELIEEYLRLTHEVMPAMARDSGQLENKEHIEASVISVHALGNETHFRLQLNTMPERVIHARMRDHWQASAGTKVWLSVNGDAAFVFPKA